ncbi:MAG TPA: hypothetical protein VGX96_00345 [Candidatus Elarobacter sp.]|nr:hypothetical protein [Candidatus Elarobacter sp.]
MTGPPPHAGAARPQTSLAAARSALWPFLAAVLVIVAIDAGAFAGTRVLGGDATDILYPWYVTALKTFWVNPAGVYDPYTLGGMPTFNFVANYDPIYAIPLVFGAVPDLGQYQLLALSHAFLIPASLLAIGVLRRLPQRALWMLAALSVVAVYLGPNFKYAADTDGGDCYAWTFAALAAFEFYRLRGRLAYAVVMVLCLDFAFMRFATAAALLPLLFVPLFIYHWRELFARPNAKRNLAIAVAVGIVVLLPNVIMQYKLYTIIAAAVNVQVVEEASRTDLFALLGMRMRDTECFPLHTMFAVPGAITLLLIVVLSSVRTRFRLFCIAVLAVLLLYSLGSVTPFAELLRTVYKPAALFRRPYAALEVALPFIFYLIAAYGTAEYEVKRGVRVVVLALTCVAVLGALLLYPQTWPLDLVLAASTLALIAVPWNNKLFAGVLALQWIVLVGYPTVKSVFYPQPRDTATEHFRPFRQLNAFLPPVGARADQAFRVIGIGVPVQLGMYAGVYQFYSVAPSRGTRVPRELALRTGVTDTDVPTIGALFAAHPELVGSPGLRAMAVRYYFVHPNLYGTFAPAALRAHPELRAVPSEGYWKIIEDPFARPFIASYARDSDVPVRLDGSLGWNGASFTAPAESDHVDLALLYDSWWTARSADGTPLPVGNDHGQLQIGTAGAHGGRVVAAYGSPLFASSVWLALATYAALLAGAVFGRRGRLKQLAEAAARAAARVRSAPSAGFGLRLARNVLIASAVYLFSLQFIFPHFVAPFAPFHDDLYVPANMVAVGTTFERALYAPRPLLWITLLFAGRFGVEGSALFVSVITIADLALAFTLLERYIVRKPMPIWIVAGTFLFAISGPGFYFVAGYDVGSSVAMLFGLLGILCWEAGARDAKAIVLTGVCFSLSTLTKEGFIPALFIYAAYAAFREPLPRRTIAALLALPVLATLVAYADGRLTNTPFVSLHPGHDPYDVSLAPADLLQSARFYLEPFLSPIVGLLFAVLAVGAWARHRTRLALGVAVTAFALWIPYLVLPNHRLEYYQWTPVPLLMLLFPLAWSRSNAEPEAGSRPQLRARLTAVSAVLIPACLVAVLWGRSQDAHAGAWSLRQQDVNRAMLAGLAVVRTDVDRSRAVLVCGLSYPFHPWEHGEFLTRDYGFGGEWTVATEPAYPPIPEQPHVRPIDYAMIRLADYDLILIFGPNGELDGEYRPAQLEQLSRQRGLAHASVYDIVSAVRSGRIAKQPLAAAP